MSDGFTTQTGFLRSAGKDARLLAEELRGSVTSVDTVEAGHLALSREIRAFDARCAGLAARFAAEGDSIGDRLIASADAYRDSDRVSAEEFTVVHNAAMPRAADPVG